MASRRPHLPTVTLAALTVSLGVSPAAAFGPQAPGGLDRPELEAILARTAMEFPRDGTLEFGIRRQTQPSTGRRGPSTFDRLESRITFEARPRGEAVLVASLYLFPDEVAPALHAALDTPLAIASLDHPLPCSAHDPVRLWLHGAGRAPDLARAVRRILDPVDALREATPVVPAAPTATRQGDELGSWITEAPLEALFEDKAEVRMGQVRFDFGPATELRPHGALGRHMGLGTFFTFIGTDAAASVQGEVVVDRRLLNPVLASLLQSPLRLASIASRFGAATDTVVVGCTGEGSAEALARGAKSVLAAAGIRPEPRRGLPADATARGAPIADRLGLSAGELADGFAPGSTPPEAPDAKWTLTHQGANTVLAMTPPEIADLRRFNLLWNDKIRATNLRCSVRLRADSGRIDQGGGPIWRFQDESNYYVARYNPLERDFRVYYVKDGRRVQLAAVGELAIRTGEWFTIDIEHVGNHITCHLNGERFLDVEDATIPQEGGVGLWTKADAAVSFAWLRVHPLP